MNLYLDRFFRFMVVVFVVAFVLEIASCSSRHGDKVQRVANVAVSKDTININTATALELESLPGIGDTLAKRIIEYRNKNGGFRRSEYLMLVPGVSERRFRQVRNRIRID